jgi:hypothetical protein
VRERLLTLALEAPELSLRELAVRFTDVETYFVSEASVYRLLKDHDLITSPAFIIRTSGRSRSAASRDFFVRHPGSDQQSRDRGRVRPHPVLGLERRRELGERDVPHRLDDLDQEVHIRRQLAPPRRPPDPAAPACRAPPPEPRSAPPVSGSPRSAAPPLAASRPARCSRKSAREDPVSPRGLTLVGSGAHALDFDLQVA